MAVSAYMQKSHALMVQKADYTQIDKARDAISISLKALEGSIEEELDFVGEEERLLEAPEAEELSAIHGAFIELDRHYESIHKLIKANKPVDAYHYLLSEVYHQDIEQILLEQIQESIEGEKQEIVLAKKMIFRKARMGRIRLLLISLMSLLVGYIIIQVLHHRISLPLEQLAAEVDSVGNGNFYIQSDISSDDEIGILARSLKTMARRMDMSLQNERELAVAAEKNLLLKESILDLQKSSEEKDLLMRELNHRVKNNLAIVSSLLNLKESESDNREEFLDVRRQIDAIRLVHEELIYKEGGERIELDTYLRGILKPLLRGKGETAIKADMSIEQRSLDPKRAVTLGLIVNELTVNALKYGFTTEHEHLFSLSLHTFPEDTDLLELIIQNSGPAIHDSVSIEKPKGLGLKLVDSLVKQLKGWIEYDRGPNPLFRIIFPA